MTNLNHKSREVALGEHSSQAVSSEGKSTDSNELQLGYNVDQRSNAKADQAGDAPQSVKEIGGPKGLEPTRYGDWEAKGRCYDF